MTVTVVRSFGGGGGGLLWSKWEAAEGDQLPSSPYMEYIVTIVVSVEERSLSVASGTGSGKDESEEAVVPVESGDGCEPVRAASVGCISFSDDASMNPFKAERQSYARVLEAQRG